MTTERADVPSRGTRPRNRRALIITAATDLFAERGYDRVGMGDLAEAVAIGPSALYRHFSGKQDLLHNVIAAGFARLHELLADLDLRDTSTALHRLAAIALDNRQIGVLWQREARHMAPPDYASMCAELRGIGQIMTERVHALRPGSARTVADLLAWSMVSVLMSVSFHRLDLPRPAYEQLLTELVDAVLTTELSDFSPSSSAPRDPAGIVPHSRREALLIEAVRMFALDGYTGVAIEDIGAAVGIAGPSVYNHFPSKRDMLVTALDRGTSVLFTDLADSYRTAMDAPDCLRRMVASYVGFTLRHHDLGDLLITETGHLPETDRRTVRQAQHDYVTEWVHLLQAVHSDADPIAARIRVHAAHAIANDAARTPHLRRHPAIAAALVTICARVLQLPAGRGGHVTSTRSSEA